MQEFDNYALALATTVSTYGSTDSSNFPSVPVSQLNHTATYINTSVVTDYDPELDPAVSPDKVVIGDDEYSLDPEGNVYDNPDYLTDSVAPSTDPDTQEVIVTVPAFDPEGNIIPEPSVEPDSEPALDPFVNPDIGLNPSPSDDVMTSGNIFTLLANFFGTYFQLLKQLLQFLFVPNVAPLKACYDLFLDKFPILEQSDSLLHRLLDYDFDSGSAPVFLIRYHSKSFNYDSGEQLLIDFSIIDDYIPFLHGVILFIAYFGLLKRIVYKIIKIFQPY